MVAELVEGKNARVCCGCEELKHFDDYHNDKNMKYGVKSRCKPCTRKQHKKYINNNKVEKPETKECRKCGEIKDTECFNVDNSRPDGFNIYCKDCRALRRLKKSIVNNQERNREQFKNHVLQKKECSTCGEYKDFDEFYSHKKNPYGLSYSCAECMKKASDEYHWENREKRLEYNKKHYQENREKYLEHNRKFREENPDYMYKYNRKWNAENKEYKRKYNREKYNNDINYKIRSNISGRIRYFVKNKSDGIKQYVGCSFDKLKKQLEDQFDDEMTWENHGQYGWHIDHIIPCSFFNLDDPRQQKICFHYSNLQPLWYDENISKHAKIPNLFKGVELDDEFTQNYLKYASA